ncbi:MAG: zinc ribbon domain-containing protein [Firmicutes bacterium]|nr:zinc ribbon domain-containing protein [Bacillota bacterium]
MPIYEYICEDCGKRFERLVLSQAEPIACPHCASQRHTLQFSVFQTVSPARSASEPCNAPGCAWTPRGCGCN